MGSKKSRRQRGTKRSKKIIRNQGRKLNGHIGYDINPMLKLHWDDKKTLKQNYEYLGISLDLNNDIGKIDNGPSNPNKLYGGAAHKTLDYIKNLPKEKAKEVISMPIKEQLIMKRLINKHGDDYKKMAYDIKINVYQKTEKQLEKRARIYKMLHDL